MQHCPGVKDIVCSNFEELRTFLYVFMSVDKVYVNFNN